MVPLAHLLLAAAIGLACCHGTARAGAPAPALPSDLSPDERQRLETIIKSSFASTRVEQTPYVVRPDIWQYLLDHPEFATHVSRALGLARYRIWQEQGALWLDDGWGVKGQFTIVYAAPGRRLMYARGHFEQKLLPDIHGQAVAALEYSFRPDGEGRTVVTTAASGYVQVDNAFLNTLGKIAAPLVQAKADREAGLLLRTFERVTRALEEKPAEVYQLVSERHDVPRRELEEFRRLLKLR